MDNASIFLTNFQDKLALNFPQNIVHQIFHEMSYILYISRFSGFSRFSADFPVNGFFRRFSAAVQDPQIFRVKFSRFSALQDPPDFPPVRQQVKFSRFSTRFSMCGIFQIFQRNFPYQQHQIFRQKKRTGNFPVLPDHFGYTLKAIYPFVVLSAMFTAIQSHFAVI